MAEKPSGGKFLPEAAQIDLISQQAADFLSQLKLERKEVMRIRLNVENVLLAWQGRFGAENPAPRGILIKIHSRPFSRLGCICYE